MTKSIEKAFPDAPERDERGRFAPGNSGNPAGTVSNFKRLLRMLVHPNIELVFTRLMGAVDDNEPWAIRLFFQEVLPLAYGRPSQSIALSTEDAVLNVAAVLMEVAPQHRDEIADKLEAYIEVTQQQSG